MHEMLNPHAKLIAVGAAPATDAMHWTTRTISKPQLASDAVVSDLAYIRSLGPRTPLPWEQAASAEDPSLR